jgi:hypothetical protein
VALPLAAWVLARWGSRRITSAAAVGFCLALPLPIMAPTTWLVLESLALLGAFNALLDVAMNAQALAVEACYQRPIMSTFHAPFSVGGVGGRARRLRFHGPRGRVTFTRDRRHRADARRPYRRHPAAVPDDGSGTYMITPFRKSRLAMTSAASRASIVGDNALVIS